MKLLRFLKARLVAPVRQTFGSARGRILASYLILLAFSTVASVAIIRQILLIRLDDRVEATLTQETDEFRRLVGGRNPRTGRPFGGDVQAIFDTYLERNVPGEGEALLTLLDGEPYRASRSRRGDPRLLEDRRDLVAGWARLTEPRRGETDTPAGPARYLAVPIIGRGTSRGVFVVANFIAGERDEVNEAVRVAGAVAGAVLLLASLAAFLAAGRVLAPLRELDDTARSITESDLTRRIKVEGDDEIAELGSTFNAMLDRLEAAFSSQRSFVNDASHELRTPITIIRGHLELLGDDPGERRETIALVIDELDRMSRFVDDLLLLAKAGQPDFLRREPVELRTLTDELLAKASALADRDWSLDARASGVVLADRQRLTQAMMNLAQNAVQHTEDGDPIRLGSAREGGEARLWVADSGPGIPPQERERVFERFARGGGHRRSEGAGLGLAIVRAIAEAHDGRVELHSRPGLGATFTIVVPMGSEPESLGPELERLESELEALGS